MLTRLSLSICLLGVLTLGALPSLAAATQSSPSTKEAFLAFALDKAKSYTEKAEVAVSKAVDTIQAEAPATVREYLVWRMWYHALLVVIPLMGVGLGIPLWVYHWKRYDLNDYCTRLLRGTEINVTGAVVGMVATGIGGFALLWNLDQLFSLVQLLVAPRVYIIERVLELWK